MATSRQKVNYYLQVLDKKLYFEEIKAEKDSSSCIILLHEGLGSTQQWKDIPDLLAEATGLRVIISDRQGYGKSDPMNLPRPFDYLEQEAFLYLVEIRNLLQINNPILIGHSDGGSIALLHASKFNCQSVITEAAHIFVEEITLDGIQQMLLHPEINLIKNKLSKYHGEKTETLFEAWTETWTHDSFRRWNIENILSGIIDPLLVIQGKEDEYGSEAQVIGIIKNSGSKIKKSVMIEACGHIPHFQAKEIVLKEMIEFIQKNKN